MSPIWMTCNPTRAANGSAVRHMRCKGDPADCAQSEEKNKHIVSYAHRTLEVGPWVGQRRSERRKTGTWRVDTLVKNFI